MVQQYPAAAIATAALTAVAAPAQIEMADWLIELSDLGSLSLIFFGDFLEGLARDEGRLCI